MGKNDFTFLLVTIITAGVYLGYAGYIFLPKDDVNMLGSSSASRIPTGESTNIEKIKKMIDQGTLSNREALFYKKYEEQNTPNSESTDAQKQPLQRRTRRRWRNAN